MKKTKPKVPRCKPRKELNTDGSVEYKYVLVQDMIKLHGDEWVGKWNRFFGVGTCPFVKYKGKFEPGIFFHDYVRFANAVDFGTHTYWD